jgi:hypothetical protein
VVTPPRARAPDADCHLNNTRQHKPLRQQRIAGMLLIFAGMLLIFNGVSGMVAVHAIAGGRGSQRQLHSYRGGALRAPQRS